MFGTYWATYPGGKNTSNRLSVRASQYVPLTFRRSRANARSRPPSHDVVRVAMTKPFVPPPTCAQLSLSVPEDNNPFSLAPGIASVNAKALETDG
jgi:hypothetical protein